MKRIAVSALPFLFSFVLLLNIIFPGIVGAQGLVPCVGTDECGICDLVTLANNVMKILIVLGVVVAALVFVNAGFLYLTSSTNPGNISRGHSLFTSALVGLVIILAAWLIIDAIMGVLFNQSALGNWKTMSILNCGS